jgi:hypothetical protein
MDWNRTITSSLFLLGAVLILVSIALPWWSASQSSTSSTTGSLATTTNFLPGSKFSYICSGSSCAFNSVTEPYVSSSTNYVNVGNMYEDVSWLLIGAGVIALAAFALWFLGGFVKFGRWLLIVICVMVLASLAMAIAAPVWTAAGQPGAFSSDSSGCNGWSGTNPCNSFFGNNCPSSGAGITYSSCSWAPGAGWYLDFAGGACVALGLVVLLRTRRRTDAMAPSGTQAAYPQTAWGTPPPQQPPTWGGGPSAAGYGQKPQAAPQAQPFAPQGATPPCRTCGQPTRFVPQYGRYYCGRCSRYV